MKTPELIRHPTSAPREIPISANREQVQELYGVTEQKLTKAIYELCLHGTLPLYRECFTLEEIVSIGIHLRKKALCRELAEARQLIKAQQAQLDYFWDKQDKKDLYL